MMTPPDLSDEAIIACVREAYRLRVRRVTFLPHNYVHNAGYRLDADDGRRYYLKLRRGEFDEVAVAVPAFLRAQGIERVMAPIATISAGLWVRRHGFVWTLYPFVEGHNGFTTPLSDAQWIGLGRTLRAVHAAALPEALSRRVPHEDYGPRWRDITKSFDQEIGSRSYDDPLARRLAEFWITKRPEIRLLVDRAEELGRALQERQVLLVLCHSDLHAGNVVLGADDELTIVDWDEPILAPKERDLMFVGAGIGAIWDDPREAALFYQGYGVAEIDPLALSYYRYERIVADLATYGEEIFGMQGSADDREHGLQGLMGQFLPGRVVAIAHRTYEKLA
jgi:spectinomycin phosphotransferase